MMNNEGKAYPKILSNLGSIYELYDSIVMVPVYM